MANEPTDGTDASASSHGSRFPLVLGITVMLLLLYPLSVCPVAKVVGNRPPRAVKAIYAPLGYLYDRVSVVHAFYNWYAKLWGVRL